METILSIAGGSIILMLGIIGYFIARNDKRQEKKNDKLTDSIDKLNDKLTGSLEKLNKSISGMNAIVLVMDERQKHLEKDFKEHKEIYHKVK